MKAPLSLEWLLPVADDKKLAVAANVRNPPYTAGAAQAKRAFDRVRSGLTAVIQGAAVFNTSAKYCAAALASKSIMKYGYPINLRESGR